MVAGETRRDLAVARVGNRRSGDSHSEREQPCRTQHDQRARPAQPAADASQLVLHHTPPACWSEARRPQRLDVLPT